MCTHYQAVRHASRYARFFKVAAPAGEVTSDMWPKMTGAFIRRPIETDPHDDAVPPLEALTGRWGLVPWGVKGERLETQLKLSTANSRDDRVDIAFTFRGAWKRRQKCIIPAEAFYEPDWRTGSHIPTRFTRADGAPMGIAGLWDQVQMPGGHWLLSYTMLMINADTHPLLREYHKPGKEKRMVVVVPEDQYGAWLDAPVEHSHDFLLHYPAAQLVATPMPLDVPQAGLFVDNSGAADN